MLEHNGKKITLENITLEDIEDIFEFDRDVMLQHRLKLGSEYIDKHFPINKEEESRVKKILARNIELSDPKTFKDPKPALTYGKVFGDDPKDKKVKEKDFKKKSAGRFLKTEKKVDTSRTRWLKG
tara:strand:+ start:224 stop:598 length:375 start_codon:yes stop_codon:yes gene_type:complete